MPYENKSIRVAVLLLLAAGCLVLTGCSEDDGVGLTKADPEFRTEEMPFAFVGVNFDESVPITGGDGPYTLVDVVSGTRDWMTVTVDAGRRIRVTGVPDVRADSLVVVEVQDSAEGRDEVVVMIRARETGEISLVGDWLLSVDVTEATGSLCAGEENAPVETNQVLVGQFGNDVMITGIQGVPSNSLSGKIYHFTETKVHIRLSGSFPEDGGTTTVEYYHLYEEDDGSISGTESWTWDFGSQHCAGKSDIVMTRVP
ncbi:hypothetical protein KDM41_03635 [bacterium]|nr:hypothetical protein [bacterium]